MSTSAPAVEQITAPPHASNTKAGSGTGVGMKFSSSAEPVLATVNVPPFRLVKSAPEKAAPMIAQFSQSRAWRAR